MATEPRYEVSSGTEETSGEHKNRARATNLARIAAVALLVLSLSFLLLNPPSPSDNGPQVTTTSTTVTTSQPSAPVTTTETKTTETKPAEVDNSPIGRVMSGSAAPLLFQVLLAILGAFLVGAIVQRVWLGEFGFTIGPVSIPALPPITAKAATEVVDLISDSPTFSEILTPGPRQGHPFPQFMSIEDDRLALLSLRTELEHRLRELAVVVGLDQDINLGRLPERLARAYVFDLSAAQGLRKYIEIGDRIAGGAKVTPEAASKLRDEAFDVLYALAELRRRALANRQ